MAEFFKISPAEIDRHWSITRLWDALIYMDIRDDAEYLAHAQAAAKRPR